MQTRAFSFSDDSAHVRLPFHSSANSPKHSSPQSHVFLQAFDSALDLFKIRQIQSEWYMDLFQSGREPWHDPYPYIWTMYNRMTEWFQSMSQNTLPALRSFFELELLYSYVYILSPSSRVPHIQEYAQRLIFEHCITYSTNLLAHLNKTSHTTKPPVTFYDAMRAYMTGRQFVDVLSRNMDAILSPIPPAPPASTTPSNASEDPFAPPIPVSAPHFPTPLLPDGHSLPQDPVTRAINTINDFTDILSRFGLRFGFNHWRERFHRESQALLTQLYNRAAASPHTSPPPQSLPTQYFNQPWMSMQGSSPQQQLHHGVPTTPPTIYAPHPSSYSSSPYNPQSSPYASQSPGQMPDWQTPSPQPVSDMPQPTEGRMRSALLYGPGIPVQQQLHSTGTDSGGPVQDPNNNHMNWR